MDPIILSADSTTQLIHVLLSHFKYAKDAKQRRSILSVITVRGRQSYEHQNVHLILTNPRCRIFIPYNDKLPSIDRWIGRTLWELRGASDDVSLEYYDPNAPKFADSEGHITSAYGERIHSQLNHVIELLVSDPTTRRAVVLVLDPCHVDDYLTDKEFPCIVGLHFYVRNEKLHCTCYMRSQSCLKVLPQDLFVFTTIHEYIAYMTGYELGSYHHFIVSAHVFEEDLQYIDTLPVKVQQPIFMVCYPLFESEYGGHQIQLCYMTVYEKALRQNTLTTNDQRSMETVSAHTEMGQWLRVLALKSMHVHHHERYQKFVETLNPIYRQWMNHP